MARAICKYAASLLAITLVIGCSSPPPNLFITSQARPGYSFDRATDTVVVSLTEKATPAEQGAIEQVRDAFVAAGFTVVEDARAADRIIYFKFADNEIVRQGLIRFGQTEAGATELTHRGLEFYAVDTEAIRQEEPDPMVWRAIILASTNDFMTHPNAVLREVADAYGKQLEQASRLKID